MEVRGWVIFVMVVIAPQGYAFLPSPVPELPEVERLRQTLRPHLLGRSITHAHLHRPDFAARMDAGQERPACSADLLQSARITNLERRGKQLAIVADGRQTLLVHLGMSGQVLVRTAEQVSQAPALTHVHAQWVLDNGLHVLFRDPRRFGGLWCWPTFAALEAHWHATLGPDALLADGDHLFEASRSGRAIKSVLLDQAVLAGVGNIYADEALFRSKVRPTRRARRLTRVEAHLLAESIRVVLEAAIASGGSTLRDYLDADGNKGAGQLSHAVYGRSGEMCIHCAKPLSTTAVSQRTTVYCTRCQR